MFDKFLNVKIKTDILNKPDKDFMNKGIFKEVNQKRTNKDVLAELKFMLSKK